MGLRSASPTFLLSFPREYKIDIPSCYQKKKKKKKGNQPIKNSRHRSIPPPLGKEREKSRGTCYAEREDVRQGGNQRNHARKASWTTEGWRGQVLGRRADSTRGEIGPRIMAV